MFCEIQNFTLIGVYYLSFMVFIKEIIKLLSQHICNEYFPDVLCMNPGGNDETPINSTRPVNSSNPMNRPRGKNPITRPPRDIPSPIEPVLTDPFPVHLNPLDRPVAKNPIPVPQAAMPQPTNPQQSLEVGNDTVGVDNREWLSKSSKDIDRKRNQLTSLLSKAPNNREEILQKFLDLDTEFKNRKRFLERLTSTQDGYHEYSHFTNSQPTKNLLISTANRLGISNWTV